MVSEVFSDDLGVGGGEQGVTGWAAGSGWSYRGGGDGAEQMIPVLEYDVGGDGSQVLEEPWTHIFDRHNETVNRSIE